MRREEGGERWGKDRQWRGERGMGEERNNIREARGERRERREERK